MPRKPRVSDEQAAKVSKAMTTPRPTEAMRAEDLLSTGSTLLNCALTGRPRGGYCKKGIYLWVGDSGALKTYAAMMMFAEASLNHHFDDYRFIFDQPEEGMLFDVEKFFGPKVVKRLSAPRLNDDDSPRYSSRVEEFWYNVDDALNAGPCIYVLDSMDAISHGDDEAKFQERKEAFEKGGSAEARVSGSYGMARAKANSSGFQQIAHKVRDTKSILFLIAQTRDRVGMGYGDMRTRGGGRAMKFYADAELWTSVVKHENATYKGNKVHIGSRIQIKVKKNRGTGYEPEIEIPFYRTHGIDDIGGCVDWLVEWKHWSKNDKGIIDATEFGQQARLDKLVGYIESEGMELELQAIVGKVWRQIEEATAIERKSRYNRVEE